MAPSATARVSRNTSFLMLATLSRMLLSFAFVIYAADYLSTKGFGQYALVTQYFELFLSLSATALGIYITREAAKRTAALPELLSHGLVLLVALLAASALVLAIIFRLSHYSPETPRLMMIAAAALIPAAVAALLEAALIALERAHDVTVATALESALRLGASFVALGLGSGLPAVFLILIVTRLLQAIYYAYQVHRVVPLRWHFRRRRFTVMARRWMVFAAENWLATIYTSLDVLILSWCHGEAAVGLYSAATRIVRLGSMVAKSFTVALFPVLSRLYRSSQTAFDQICRLTVRYMVALAVPTALAIAVFAQPIIALLYKPEYAPAVPILRVFVWILVLECINPFLSYTLFARGAQHLSLRVAAVGLVVNIIASSLLAWQYGPVGSAVGSIIAAAAATCGYCLAGLAPTARRDLLLDAGKIALAAGALSLVLRLSDGTVGAIAGGLILGVGLYVGLLFVLRVVSRSDARLWNLDGS